MATERLSREEIALRLLCAHIRSGRSAGPSDVRDAFALTISFEERSNEVGQRPYRSVSRRGPGPDDDGD